MSDELRVAQIEPVGAHGGMHYYDLGLAEGLAAAGVGVELYTSSTGGAEARPGVRFHEPFAGIYGDTPRWLRGLRFAIGLRRAMASLERLGVDLLHLHFFGSGATEPMSLRSALRRHRPTVITVHDVESLADVTPASDPSLYAPADHLVVHNEASRRELARFRPEATIDVIPHGHYLNAVRPADRGASRQALGLAADRPTALFFGQIKVSKGLDLLLRAWREVVERLPAAQLLVAGRVWRDDPERYRASIRELGIENQVDFRHGFVAERDVAALFAASDLVVLPYRRVYQSGVLLMAASLARPVLVSDLPAMREGVEEGRTGFLFRSEDTDHLAARLAELLADRDRLAAVAGRARAAVESGNDWGRIGRLTVDLYRRVLAKAG